MREMKRMFSMTLAVMTLVSALFADAAFDPECTFIPTAEKCKENGLLFLASFDTYNVNADFARGDKLALTCPDISLLLRGQYGFDGGQAYKAEPSEELVYPLAGNLIPEQGTLSVWVRIDDFAPDDQTISNAGIYRIFVRNGETWTENFAYITKGTLYFCNHGGTGMMPDFNSFGANIKLEGIKRGQWFLVTTSWNSQTASFYLNGKKAGTGPAPRPIQSGPGSFIGLNCRIWWQTGLDTRQHLLAVDDLKVYNYAMSDLQVAKKYNDLLKNPKKLSNLLILNASGKDMGPGKCPLLRIDIDARAIDDANQAEYHAEGPGLSQSGKVPLQNGTAELLFDVPATGGEYTLSIQCMESSQKLTVNVPDCSFALEPEVPLTIPFPWTKPVWNEQERSVEVWNRKYVFGASPFPQKALANGEELLQSPPMLLAENRPIIWEAGEVEATSLGFILHGTGKCGKLQFRYTTLVEYDGMIKVDFDMSTSQQQFNSLKLEWQVARPFCQYLMTPRYFNGSDDELTFDFPSTPFRAHFMLWLTSEQAGFCWVPESDANWASHAPDRAMRVNRKTGSCSVDLISKDVLLDGDYHYAMFFCATPTRRPEWSPDSPLRAMESCKIPTYWGAKNHHSFDYDEMMLEHYAGVYRDKTIVVYGMGHGQNAANPLASYLHRSWELPGCFIYKIGHAVPNHQTGRYDYFRDTPNINVCAQCPLFADYISGNIRQLLASPYGEKFRMLYFDLGSVNICRNQEHGCGYKDRFGKSVGTLTAMGLRRFYQRMLQEGRRHNIPMMTHGQDCFVPFVNGIGDYWFPGEQFQAWTGRDEYGYTDKVPVALYRTETNRKILGCNVAFLPEVPQDVATDFRFHANESMMTMLLAHDIDWSELIEQTVPRKVKDILRHYNLGDQSVVPHLYYDQNTITSSDARVWVTWYDCPENRKLMILANRTPENVNTRIDLRELNLAVDRVIDEYANRSFELKDGILEISMNARSFAIIGLPGKPWLPLHDGFETCWIRYLCDNVYAPYGDIGFMNEYDDEGVYRTAPPAMRIPPVPDLFLEYANEKLKPHWTHSFVKQVPVEAGKSYHVSIWGRTRGLPKDGEVRVRLQPMANLKERLGPPMDLKLTPASQENWEEIAADIVMPEKSNWLQVELESLKAGDAGIWFDDFSMVEHSRQ